jgi:four helix bundle protein
VQDFRKLKVWEKAHQLALSVYRVTANFPKEELYGLTSQIRRASMSIATNIAEGCGRSSGPDFGRFLQIAMGSACETEYQLLLSKDLGCLAPDEHAAMETSVQEVKRMLAALLKSLHTNHRMLEANGRELKADSINA